MSLYSWINLISLSIPLAVSFHPLSGFIKKWDSFLFGTAAMMFLFIPWDILFTHWGVWGFDARYISGNFIAGLPVEEWSFFICIPYCCIFTFKSLEKIFPVMPLQKLSIPVFTFLGILFILTGLFFYEKAYTFSAFFLAGSFLIFHIFFLRTSWLSKFLFPYLIILFPFFIINGILTGSWIEGEVVWYNNAEIIGIRIFTIPLEDTVYGLLMILLSLTVFEYHSSRKFRHSDLKEHQG